MKRKYPQVFATHLREIDSTSVHTLRDAVATPDTHTTTALTHKRHAYLLPHSLTYTHT